ncbi:zinc finger protein 532-like [Mizuhopecten yessoensis]|uniref:Zinc finger protein 592 n=1 Tax=Mizuhopecten yessoensis TaxID=6573 RepID=A0A210QRQ9_MIZYE|nr:zinc finger protein 532-like [Mizuhopecten yessoensis]OWF51378.1 Zinc finger protein 592 [Mizuhopecten yessoensis]
MDSKSDEVDGKTTSEKELGVGEILEDVTSTNVTKITSGVEDVDRVTSSTSTRTNHCSDQIEENGQISAESNQQAEASVNAVQSSSAPDPVPGNKDDISMETDSKHTPESSEANTMVTEHALADSTAVEEPCCDGSGDTEGIRLSPKANIETVDSSDNRQATDITMETGDSVADSSCGLSQIQIICVQSMATDSLGMEFEDSIQISSEDQQETVCPVTSQRSEVTGIEDTSRSPTELLKVTKDDENAMASSVCVEESPRSDVSTSAQSNVSSSEAPQSQDINFKDNLSSKDSAISAVAKSDSDITISTNILQPSTKQVVVTSQSWVANHVIDTSIETATDPNILLETTIIVPNISSGTAIAPDISSGTAIAPDTSSETATDPNILSETSIIVPNISSGTAIAPDTSIETATDPNILSETSIIVPNIWSGTAIAPDTSSETANGPIIGTISNQEDKAPSQETSSSSQSKGLENSEELSINRQDGEVTVTSSVPFTRVRSSGETTSQVVDNSAIKACLASGPQVLAVQAGIIESQDIRKSSIAQKFSSYTLKKARSMLQSALETMPIVNNHPQLQQVNQTLSTGMNNCNSPLKVTTHPSNRPEEHGDILDILKTHQKEATSEIKTQEASLVNKTAVAEKSRRQGSNQIAKKSTTKKPIVPITGVSEEPSIKQEPADGYTGYGYSEPAKEATNSEGSSPSVVIENVQGNQVSSSINHNSINLLSSQVNRLPTVTSNQNSLLPSVAMMNANPTHVLGTLVPSNPGRPIAHTLMSTTISDVTRPKFVPVMAGFGPGKGPNRVTIRLSNTTAVTPSSVSLSRMPKPHRAPRPIQPKGSEMPQPKATTVAVANKKVHTISTPALLQTNATIKTTIPPPMSVSTINIDTVGLPRITELIARKNPIPNYKAPTIPENLKGVIKEESYLCYECGDLFLIESSLTQHRGRYSMKIAYKCDECNKEKCFFNKCQFLGHLRQHLNIDKSQAVPIHIKSDSISIAPLPKIYESLIFQTSVPTKNAEEKKSQQDVVKEAPSPKKRCRECGMQLTMEERTRHFNTSSTNCDFWNCCNICQMILPSICALRAHRRLHTDPDSSNCPECGEQFFKEVITYKEKPLDSRSAFIQHLRYQCCHISRIAQMQCPKCKDMLESGPQIKNHVLAKLDQYYKCQICPMAFRTAAGFERHFVSHKKGNPVKKDYKRIYKCHICDTVLDDITVLEVHIAGHVKELKRACTYGFVCIDCRQVFPSKEDLSKHITENHPRIANKTICVKCNKSFGNIYECFVHDLVMHRSSVVPEYRPCKLCGNVMEIDEFLSHPCNRRKTKEKYVCNFCDKEILKKKHLTTHMEWHKTNGAAVCLKCFRTDFSDMTELKNHEVICSGSQQTQAKPTEQCVDCKLEFLDKGTLEKHRAQNHPDLFPCHLCGDTYQSQDDLKNHVTVKHVAKRNVYPCHICNSRGIKKAFSSNALLEKHLSCRHRQGRNPVMSQKFIKQEDEESSGDTDQDKEEVDDSKRKHEEVTNSDQPFKKLRVEGETRFTCAKCSLTCEDRATFLKHLVDHKVENFIQCMECGLSFAVLPSLRKHLFMVHKVKDFKMYCQDNDVKEAMDVDYDREIKDIPPVPEMEVVHDSDSVEEEDSTRNPLECRVCKLVLESEADLRTHTRTHGMAFIRNKRRNKMVPSAKIRPPEMNGVDTDGDSSSLSLD